MNKWTPVKVEWTDSSGCGEWDHDYELLAPFHCESVGLLIRQDDEAIVIGLSVANKGASHNEQVAHYMAIPKVCVMKITKLKVA